uniref:Family with sequence similarity 13 member A n=1 Tax=Salmo trutta TaxID=8032 RepID=A0A673XE68_SALTR
SLCVGLCHNKAAVQIKQDMKKMVQLPMLRGTSRGPRGVEARGGRLFGVSLLELRELGLVKDGVPLVVRRMVEFLREHALHHEGLFRVNGNVRAVEGLKLRLENGEDVDFLVEADVCTVASLFKQYLRDLPEGLVDSTVQPALIQQHQDGKNDGFCSDLRVLLHQLPDVHYSLLQYLCLFLTQVDQRHRENRMTALNLATVFGPNVFHVSSGFDGIQEQNICNKIMAKLIQNYSSIFNNNYQDDDHKEEHCVFNRDGDRGEHIQESLPSNIIIHRYFSRFNDSCGRSFVWCISYFSITFSPPLFLSLILSLLPSPSALSISLSSILERTIRSAVEQHLFDVHMCGGGQSTTEDSESTGCSSSPEVTPTARQRRRHQREQEEAQRHRDRTCSLPALVVLCLSMVVQTRLSSMKIQELPSSCETADRRGVIVRSSDQECGEDVPRLDLSVLTDNNNWGEPVPAYSSWQRESMDSEEACISPQVGGRLIRQLIEEDSDPMLSPRFHAYGHCQQYIDDTEVPPSPPNAHSFASRRRSSSLGSCGDDDQQELTSAQLSKKIHGLKRKIHKYEEKFEEERKYRPSHSDKADNPEVLKWMNELAKLRKDLKEHKLHKSEEDLPPLTRQRSNTLPKSFGSQLEKKPQQEKAPKPPVENTLEGVQNKLQEKRDEVGRPEDVKDMTREQIGAEKVALQKALLYYEGIHGRPVTKTERQIMKPLYDRYRLVKQILCRASTIPVIASPSSKRRGPQLQPIIEGEAALFFDDIKEEEDGSEDDSESNNKPQCQITGTVRPDFSMLGFLDQLEEETDGFISPVDELSPSKNTTDMRLSNLHSATMPELVEQLQEAREEKKRIRKNLREFEDQFFRQNGRNVQKEDRSPLAVEYNEYKHIKAKLRLIEVLISKGDASKFL